MCRLTLPPTVLYSVLPPPICSVCFIIIITPWNAARKNKVQRIYPCTVPNVKQYPYFVNEQANVSMQGGRKEETRQTTKLTFLFMFAVLYQKTIFAVTFRNMSPHTLKKVLTHVSEDVEPLPHVSIARKRITLKSMKFGKHYVQIHGEAWIWTSPII